MTSIEIRPFTAADLDGAARLLAQRHARDRARTPDLPARFDEPDVVRPLLAAQLDGPLVHGVAAFQSDEMVGFLIGTASIPPPGAWWAGYGPRRSGEIAYAGYAASGLDQYDLYRAMYAALAPFFIQHGCFSQGIEVHAGDNAALAAWRSLGFGQVSTLSAGATDLVDVRDTPVPAGVTIRRAEVDDLDALLALGDELDRHQNRSPIFLPYLPEETHAGYRDVQRDLLANPANAHWVAYRGDSAVGMHTFHEQDSTELARVDRAVYLFVGVTASNERGTGLGGALLRRSMAWAREEGYERCTLHFLSSNLSAARFWTANGFRPLTHRLVRNVDERIAWTH